MAETAIEKRNGMAITSLVLSIVGIFTYGLASIFGVIFGHVAKNQIRKSPETYGGDGMATAGLILGYLIIAGWVIVTISVGSFLANL